MEELFYKNFTVTCKICNSEAKIIESYTNHIFDNDISKIILKCNNCKNEEVITENWFDSL